MQITILTLFPEMFSGPFDYSIIKRAKEKKLVDIKLVNIRDFGIGKHRTVDDTPYGGGVGMIMRVDVLHKAITYAKSIYPSSNHQKVVLLSASGKTFTQQRAKDFSILDHLILLCGHYEGVDERIKHYIDQEISIGDFILTGGEIPAMLVADAVTRLIPGVLPEGATDNESFSLVEAQNAASLLEYPHYTKPQTYENHSVPDVLLCGNHKQIEEWRLQKAKELTKKRRPDLLDTKEGTHLSDT